MAPRMVSSSDSKIRTSPVLSRTASIVSFDSDTYPSHWQMSPTASEAPGPPSAEFGAKHTSLLEISEGNTPRGTLDDSFVRHDAYFFEDGNVTFLIDGTLYCVHRYLFSRDSAYFSTRFAQLGIRDHEALSTIISIGDVKRNDFEALLSILYPTNFEVCELKYEQWKSVLHLSMRWGFTSLRKLALKSITPPTPHDQLVLARAYSVDQWVLPALTALCSRTLPLSLDEALQMSMEDVILVATVREEIRGGALQVDSADIPRHVEVALAGMLNHPVCKDVYWDKTKSTNAGQESDSMIASAVDLNVEADIAETMGLTSTPGSHHGDKKEGDTREGDVERSLKEVPVGPPGVGQPHVVQETPPDCQKKSMVTSAMPTSETQKSEETSGKAAAWTNAEALREQEEAAHTKERADAEPRNAAAEAENVQMEANAKCEADLKTKAEGEAQALTETERKACEEKEEATRVGVKVDAGAKEAAKKAKKPAKKAVASNDKWDMLPFHTKGKKKKGKK